MVRGARAPGRHLRFTLYAPEDLGDDDQREWLRQRAVRSTAQPLQPPVRFIVCQLERGNESNRLHLQGYIQWLSPQRYSRAHSVVDPRVSCGECDGTPQQNLDYCTKDDTRVEGPWMAGTMARGKGQRVDLAAFRARIDEGATDHQLYVEFPEAMAKYPNFPRNYRSAKCAASAGGTERNTEPHGDGPRVYVYWGPTGVGKSRRAWYESYAACSPILARGYGRHGGKCWFQNYTPGSDVILEEYDGQLPINELKRILDRYPCDVEFKGGSVRLSCERIFITSNVDPQHWYPISDQVAAADVAALMRRLHVVEHMQQPWIPPAPVAPDEPSGGDDHGGGLAPAGLAPSAPASPEADLGYASSPSQIPGTY